MGNRTKEQFKFMTLVGENVGKTIDNLNLVLALFYANDQEIIYEDDYKSAYYAAENLLQQSKEDLKRIMEEMGLSKEEGHNRQE